MRRRSCPGHGTWHWAVVVADVGAGGGTFDALVRGIAGDGGRGSELNNPSCLGLMGYPLSIWYPAFKQVLIATVRTSCY